MSILLRFQKGSLNTSVALRDSALTELLAFVSKHQDDSQAEASTPPGHSDSPRQAQHVPLASISIRDDDAKGWLKMHGASEVLTKLDWATYPEKILALAAFHESKEKPEDESTGWKSSDIAMRFSEAKEPLPVNLSRDVSLAVKNGHVTPVTKRTYKVSRTGWLKIADGIKSVNK